MTEDRAAILELSPAEAFDIIVDKIKTYEDFECFLVARAVKGDVTGFRKLEGWIKKRGYATEVRNAVLFYYPKKKPKNRIRRLLARKGL